MMRKIERERKGSFCPGQDLVIAGYAGCAGARLVALKKEDELLSRFSKEFVRGMKEPDTWEIGEASHPWADYGAAEWEEAGEGGIYTALWVLSGAYGTGFELDLYRVPVKQAALEVCEQYDLNPYRLYSQNCMVFSAENGEHLAEVLRGHGIRASVAGRVKKGVGREVYYGEVRGFMERPREDELTRVLGPEWKRMLKDPEGGYDR